MKSVLGRFLVALLLLVLPACGTTERATAPPNSQPTAEVQIPSPSPDAVSDAPRVDTSEGPAEGSSPDPAEHDAPDGAGAASEPPEWLGTRVLPAGPEGYADAQPTPPELEDRRLITADVLPPPPDGAFASSVSQVPDDVADRSTWTQACPVALADLRYATVSFWGFDERPHTGELLVHRDVADNLVDVFTRLFEARFPIEEMRITRPDELDAPPTGDGNNTGAFVCRPSRGSARWSEHAFGLAVDVNPFHNPLVRGETILPELATAYADRTWERAGMIQPGDDVVEAFSSIGWTWGGDWSSLADYMHFSHNGR